jgi:hypothetical protein
VQSRCGARTPEFQEAFQHAVEVYRKSLEPSNLEVAKTIRDDPEENAKLRLKAIESLRGPSHYVTQNNSGSTTVLPGYVIRLTDPAPEPKTIDHQADMPIVPPRQSTVGGQAAELKAEKAEAFAFKPR